MKIKIFFIIFLLSSANLFSVNLGFNMKQEIVFVDKTEYTPEVYSEYFMNTYFETNKYYKNLIFSICPNLYMVNNDLYFNIYKFNFNIFFNNFTFCINKDLFYYGLGKIANLTIPQSLNIDNKDKNIWHTKFDISISNIIFSCGMIIDDSIDIYEPPTFFNPLININYNNNQINVIYTLDYLFSEENTLKNAIECEFLTKGDLSIYSSMSLITDFVKKINFNVNIGVSKPFLIYDFMLTPLFEFDYFSKNSEIEFLFYLYMDFSDFITSGIGFFCDYDNSCNIRTEIDIFFPCIKFNIIFQSKNLIKDDKNDGYLSIGIDFKTKK